jgi:CBS-domain-containing membrane protein
MPSPPDDAATLPAVPPDGRPGPPRWRRRRIVIDPPYQIRGGLLVGAMALVLLALLNAALVTQGRAGQATAAAWTAPAASGEGFPLVVLLAGSAVFLAVVVLVAILESHRTAGAAFAIRRTVEGLRDGRPGERVRLRRNDHLKDLAEAVNRLAESIDDERNGRR